MCNAGGLCTALLLFRGLCQRPTDDSACHPPSLLHEENRSAQVHALLQSEFRLASSEIPEDTIAENPLYSMPTQKARKEIRSVVSLGSGDSVVKKVRELERRRVENSEDPESPRVVFPLPVYIHAKGAEGNIFARAMGNDLFGDSLEPSDHGVGLKHEAGKEEHVVDHCYIALLFLFSSLVVGGSVMWLLERFGEGLPYTCSLFLSGLIVAVVHHVLEVYIALYAPTWHHSVLMWQKINPHLFFYVFLPALIFGEAMTLQVQLAWKCLGQILILAGPGVLIGACLTGAFAKYVMPYGWDWSVCMVFGSILSATDPVAVVALFNTLGVNPRLTMLISGESLLNDGAAMVLFILFLKMSLGATVNTKDVLCFFAHMTVTSCLLGAVIGGVAVWAVGHCSEDNHQSNAIIQLIVSISCGYLAFYLAEAEFSTSGVLATVSAGVVVSHSLWPRIVSREAMHTVWEMVEFIGNTLVFFVAGLMFGGICLSRKEHIGLQDYAYLLLLYVVCTLIRTLMILILWIPLHFAGTKIEKREGVAMVWSGLRGAVGLVMAVIFDLEPDIDHELGSRIMFHVGGIAALTTLINATSTKYLLQVLQLTKTERMKEKMISHLHQSMSASVQGLFDSQIREPDGIRFAGASPELVFKMVPALQAEGQVVTPRSDEVMSNHEEKMHVKLYREVFLRVVETHYWDALNSGMLPRKIRATRELLASTTEALDMSGKALNDWMILDKAISHDLVGPIHHLQTKLYSMWPMLFKIFKGLSRATVDTRACFAILSFLHAHTRAQQEVPQYFGRADSDLDYIWKKVNFESQQQCQLARQRLANMPRETIIIAKSKMLARKILGFQLDEVRYYQCKGVITENMARTLEERVNLVSRRLLKEPSQTWLNAMYGQVGKV